MLREKGVRSMDRKILDKGKHKMRWRYSNGEAGENNAGFDVNIQGSKQAILALIDEMRKFIEAMPLTEAEKRKTEDEKQKTIEGATKCE